MTLVYHYTDANGLLGILTTRHLWCTHVSFLNDNYEHRIGRTLYLEMVNSLAQRTSEGVPDWLRAVARAALLRVPPVFDLKSTFGLDRGFFVASFTRAFDSLSHWRGYSTPSSRYCIGFELEQLEQLASSKGIAAKQVDYDNLGAIADMRQAFTEAALDAWRKHDVPGGYHPGVPENWHPPELQHLNSEMIRIGAPFIKHESFVEESEYRLSLRTEDVERLGGAKGPLANKLNDYPDLMQ